MDNTMSHIERSIIQTICFFDMFNMPLSAFEVWYYLYTEEQVEELPTLSDIEHILNSLVNKNLIEHTSEYYYIVGRGEIITVRKRQSKNAIVIYRKAYRYVKLLSALPYVRGIALCNMAPLGNVSVYGDIDLFIIVKSNYIWIARFWVLLVLALLRQRPGDRDSSAGQYPLCPSFFVAEDALNCAELQVENDIYMRYWVANIMPFYDSGGVFSRFDQENKWVRAHLPHIRQSENATYFTFGNGRLVSILKSIVEWMFSARFINKICYYIQERRLPQENGTAIIINDSMVKCHIGDRREYFRNTWIEKVNQFLEK